ncbi:hypothetical protein B6A10_01475 [Flavobacterium sp. L1I52]|uniref:Phage abortive infection protein n=1 Tax=Flavobacterium pokkalii TaxID=1940408 RepID=A0ABR7UNR8_9FLAO|nr:hypothetical protein [Flavobacterium pokkalii]MBD0723843.1 hypothetical protein [Flavobacterium pokkalii]
MKNVIEEIFFFLHRHIEKLNSIFNSKIISLILAPLLPFSVVILSVFQLSNGVYILFHSIMILLGIIFTFILGVSSFYFYKNDSIYVKINREKSNKNLSQFQNSQKSSKNISERKINELLDSNKDVINHYYKQFRKIDLFNDDTSLSDFQILIGNCLKKSKDKCLFKLEVNAMQTHGFINEFMIPFLIKIDSNYKVSKKIMASLFLYKKAGKYFPVNEKSLSDIKRILVTPYQREIYESLKKR